MAKIELNQLLKTYPGRVRAVDSIDLTLQDREYVVLVGPSGCGKSTTLRLIAGLEQADGGKIRIGEQDVARLPPKERDVAMVFQNYALYPHLTVRDNLAFGLKMRGVGRSDIESRVLETAKALDLGELLSRKPRQLSGGQRQRVALGRAIVRRPAAFLFDEPLSNLDARLRVQMRSELRRLHQRFPTTTLHVTHDQEEAMTLGDRIVVMNEGKIQQVDSPIDLYERPRNRFVAGFIGTPPINFFEGVLEEAGEGVGFRETASSAAGKGINGQLTSSQNGLTLWIPPNFAPSAARTRLGRFIGKAVTLGVRPEHLKVHWNPTEVPAALEARVDMIEQLGHSMDVGFVTACGSKAMARLQARREARVGDKAYLSIDVRGVHVFEPGPAGLNLTTETSMSSPNRNEPTHALA